MSTSSHTLLDVRGLSVDIGQGANALRVVKDVSLSVNRGEAVGLVGESGSGKSMTAFAIMNLFASPRARVAEGQVWLDGRDLSRLSSSEMKAVRGAGIGMVFQDPTSYLDPLIPVGRQIAEPLRAHGRTDGLQARVLELIDLMELSNAKQVAAKYPHELSGGMRQRVLIAAALAMRPSLLIADEPTTALDVTVQAAILALLMRLRKELDLGILLITHDLAVVAETCQRVNVMYAGEIVETNEVGPLFERPRHPYTQGLLASILHPRSRARSLFSIPGGVPVAGHWPSGCRFHRRCPIARKGLCEVVAPALVSKATAGDAADRCLLSDEPIAVDAWGLRPADLDVQVGMAHEHGASGR
ncbi:MAG: Peptide/nickel transport system ATP-binding protein [Rhizobacter sp.]|nr:Peptide/nickel transport system ATP-binding protein [Rhizobacter sp.]